MSRPADEKTRAAIRSLHRKGLIEPCRTRRGKPGFRATPLGLVAVVLHERNRELEARRN